MGPFETAHQLVVIANKIDQSFNPSRTLVIQDINQVINKIARSSNDLFSAVESVKNALTVMNQAVTKENWPIIHKMADKIIESVAFIEQMQPADY